MKSQSCHCTQDTRDLHTDTLRVLQTTLLSLLSMAGNGHNPPAFPSHCPWPQLALSRATPTRQIFALKKSKHCQPVTQFWQCQSAWGRLWAPGVPATVPPWPQHWPEVRPEGGTTQGQTSQLSPNSSQETPVAGLATPFTAAEENRSLSPMIAWAAQRDRNSHTERPTEHGTVAWHTSVTPATRRPKEDNGDLCRVLG